MEFHVAWGLRYQTGTSNIYARMGRPLGSFVRSNDMLPRGPFRPFPKRKVVRSWHQDTDTVVSPKLPVAWLGIREGKSAPLIRSIANEYQPDGSNGMGRDLFEG